MSQSDNMEYYLFKVSNLEEGVLWDYYQVFKLVKDSKKNYIFTFQRKMKVINQNGTGQFNQVTIGNDGFVHCAKYTGEEL